MPGFFAIDVCQNCDNLSKEEEHLLAQVNDERCIEVFFIEKFIPPNAYGGGFAWLGGTVAGKVVISVEVVRCPGNKPGVHKTLLAHEVSISLTLLCMKPART